MVVIFHPKFTSGCFLPAEPYLLAKLTSSRAHPQFAAQNCVKSVNPGLHCMASGRWHSISVLAFKYTTSSAEQEGAPHCPANC